MVATGSAIFSSSSIGSIGFVAISYSIDWARVVGNSEALGIVVGYFS